MDRAQCLKDTYLKYGIPVSPFNIFGIRNEEKQKEDIWNDWIGYFTNTDFQIYKGTTDPGIYWTVNPMNRLGTAHMCLGYHKKIWTVGKHQGKYTALCNTWKCLPTKVWRDFDKDTIQDANEKIEKSWIGLNLHKSNDLAIMTKIGKYSAACQVLVDHDNFEKLLQSAIASKQLWFDYFLFDKSQISFFGELV